MPKADAVSSIPTTGVSLKERALAAYDEEQQLQAEHHRVREEQARSDLIQRLVKNAVDILGIDLDPSVIDLDNQTFPSDGLILGVDERNYSGSWWRLRLYTRCERDGSLLGGPSVFSLAELGGFLSGQQTAVYGPCAQCYEDAKRDQDERAEGNVPPEERMPAPSWGEQFMDLIDRRIEDILTRGYGNE